MSNCLTLSVSEIWTEFLFMWSSAKSTALRVRLPVLNFSPVTLHSSTLRSNQGTASPHWGIGHRDSGSLRVNNYNNEEGNN